MPITVEAMAPEEEMLAFGDIGGMKMRREVFPLLLILLAVACWARHGGRQSSPDGGEFAGEVLVQPSAGGLGIEPPELPLCFRWSLQGGCFNVSDYFFELRSTTGGAGKWRATVCRYPGQILGEASTVAGNYEAVGTLSKAEMAAFRRDLETAGVWEMRPAVTGGVGGYRTVYFSLGGESRCVPAFQKLVLRNGNGSCDVAAVYKRWLGYEIEVKLFERSRSGPADAPLKVPDWAIQDDCHPVANRKS